jgi:hypothetical protein
MSPDTVRENPGAFDEQAFLARLRESGVDLDAEQAASLLNGARWLHRAAQLVREADIARDDDIKRIS